MQFGGPVKVIRNDAYLIECHGSNQVSVTIRCQKQISSRPRPPVVVTAPPTSPPVTTAVSVPQDLYIMLRQINSVLSQHTKMLEQQVRKKETKSENKTKQKTMKRQLIDITVFYTKHFYSASR